MHYQTPPLLDMNWKMGPLHSSRKDHKLTSLERDAGDVAFKKLVVPSTPRARLVFDYDEIVILCFFLVVASCLARVSLVKADIGTKYLIST